MANVVGRARAKSLGYYPDDGVHFRLINEGEEFDIIEGREKGSWFERLDTPAETEAAPVATKPRKSKGAAPAPDTPDSAPPAEGSDESIV